MLYNENYEGNILHGDIKKKITTHRGYKDEVA